MKNRKVDQKASKKKDSDNEDAEDEQQQQVVVKTLTAKEREERELENAQVIPDSEISPAAALFLQQSEENREEIALLEHKSTKIKCPYCDAVSYSLVEYRPSFLGYLMVVLAMLIFGILSLVLLPFLISLTKQALHRCAKCLNEVKDTSYFGMTSMEDKLLSLQIGSFGIILTRKFLLYIVMVLSSCMAIYLFVLAEEGHNHEARPITGITWDKYKADCGFDTYIQNPKAAQQVFNKKYLNRGVSWDGYVIRVSFNDEDPLSMAYHSASMLIKMDGDDIENSHGADIGLSLSERVLNANRDMIDSLRKGDHIKFNSTIQSIGDRNHLHHLHTFELEKLDGHKDVEAHAHANGRYKLAAAKKPEHDTFPGVSEDLDDPINLQEIIDVVKNSQDKDKPNQYQETEPIDDDDDDEFQKEEYEDEDIFNDDDLGGDEYEYDEVEDQDIDTPTPTDSQDIQKKRNDVAKQNQQKKQIFGQQAKQQKRARDSPSQNK